MSEPDADATHFHCADFKTPDKNRVGADTLNYMYIHNYELSSEAFEKYNCEKRTTDWNHI